MELRDYVEILRRRWLSACVVALLVLAAAVASTLLTTRMYTATTRVFFAVQGTQSVSELAQGSTFAENQMISYAQVATSPLVLEPVIGSLGLATSPDLLRPSVKAVVPTGTVILEVDVTRADRQEAMEIANAISEELATVATDLFPARSTGDQAVKATVLARAQLPTSQSSPDVLRNLLLGLALGIVLGVAAALARNMLDTKIRNDVDVRRITERPLLGAIAFDDRMPAHPVVVADDPLSAPAEAIRRLRTNLQFVGAGEGHKTLVITSSIPGEGKSTTSINVAVSLAEAGSRVLLIDADLRRPSVADYLGMEGRAGLTSVLIGQADPADVIQVWRGGSLHVLPSGVVPPNPSELLASTAMETLLTDLSLSYDVILLDSPPLLPVTDATILAKLTGGALVIVGADRIHRAQLNEALDTLATAGATVQGLVLNKIARRDSSTYGYGYTTYYGGAGDETTAAAAPAPGESGTTNKASKNSAATALVSSRRRA